MECPSVLTIQEQSPPCRSLEVWYFSFMGLFHSGMNHWQRQWLSDRLQKKNDDPSLARIQIEKPLKPKRQATKAKKTAKNPLKGSVEN